MRKIAIIGMGVVGAKIRELFPDATCYDPFIEKFQHADVDSCHFAFICVPTPHHGEGLDMKSVEMAVRDHSPNIFIVCSALQPGTADRLMDKYNKRIVVQPEYLGETVGHPLSDLSESKFLILGGSDRDVNEVIGLYYTVYSANIKIRKVSAIEAEIIKLTENRAAAFKVAQCQELYDACKRRGVDYTTIQQAVYGDDPRFNLYWTAIYPEKRGFNSKCIPKDVYGWEYWAGDCELTSALLEYNDKLI